MKKMSKLLSLIVMSLLFMVGCGENEEAKEKNTVHKVEETENAEEKEKQDQESFLSYANELAENSVDSEEIYITDILNIGEEEEVQPGIYDLEVTGGSGNIFGDRDLYPSLFINWVAGSADNEGDYPSKIRMILFEGDELEFSDISKVKFHAITEDVDPSHELGIGEFIVGRDILPGDYKISTEVELNPEFDNLGWGISISNLEKNKSREQTYTASNNDVMVKLEEGEVISISYDNTDYGSSADDARLIFNEQ